MRQVFKRKGRAMECGDGERTTAGVLLYYKFTEIPDPLQLKRWFTSLCSSLSLLGRIRIAPQGINVTVGGTLVSLENHMKAVDSHPLLKGCDFKLAPSLYPINWKIARECGFNCLSVRIVQELVTLGLHPSVQPPSISDAGEHLSAQEFHRRIEQAVSQKNLHDSLFTDRVIKEGSGNIRSSLLINTTNSLQQDANDKEDKLDPGYQRGASEEEIITPRTKNLLVLDARNIYEVRIGKFVPPPGVEFFNPHIRQYSDLPEWIDSNLDSLRNKCILMYCTGGVRCEMASAYLKTRGEGFEDVYQLSGGIQRYLEAFPDGGFFRGKNFVFDHRIAVASSWNEVIGSCMVCRSSFDDYSLRCRCSYCRMLVLVCSSCQTAGMLKMENPVYTCELCRANGREDLSQYHQMVDTEFTSCSIMESASSKHHEQQTFHASNTRDTSDVYSQGEQNRLAENEPDRLVISQLKKPHGTSSKTKLKILCLHGFRQNASSLKGRLASFTKKLKHLADFVFVDAPHEVPFISKLDCKGGTEGNDELNRAGGCIEEREVRSEVDTELPYKKRYAWLVRPNILPSKDEERSTSIVLQRQGDSMGKSDEVEGLQDRKCCGLIPNAACGSLTQAASGGNSTEKNRHRATMTFDEFQYKEQTAGWADSWSYLQNVFYDLGPFDGILGFSQGAAVAAALCHLRKNDIEQGKTLDFQFVILCSGFLSPAQEHQFLTPSSVPSPLDCPSLHIFSGTEGCDQQISTEASMQLVSIFRTDCRVVLKHKQGHIVPTQIGYMNEVRAFLQQFL